MTAARKRVLVIIRENTLVNWPQLVTYASTQMDNFAVKVLEVKQYDSYLSMTSFVSLMMIKGQV